MNNVYLVDTNQYLGSWQEGTDQLHTLCQDGQQINWSALAISPSNDVSIQGFSGDMVSKNICKPTLQGSPNSPVWDGQVQTRGNIGSYSYTVQLSIDGRALSFTPFLKVV